MLYEVITIHKASIVRNSNCLLHIMSHNNNRVFFFQFSYCFFNFVKNTAVPDLSNPCDSTVLAKPFRVSKLPPWTILERDAVDEFIFKTESPRNRLMLELMARGGMRIGEVLKLKPQDVQDRKLHLPNPKSGRASEVVFIPQKVADRLRDYIAAENILDDKRIFPLGYTRAREIVKSAGNKIGIDVKPHDLRNNFV